MSVFLLFGCAGMYENVEPISEFWESQQGEFESMSGM